MENRKYKTTMYSPPKALAAWDMLEIRCRQLKEDFHAARCQNLNCNLDRFKINKPRNVNLKSYPVFAPMHFRGMPKNVEVLVPVGCYCKASIY